MCGPATAGVYIRTKRVSRYRKADMYMSLPTSTAAATMILALALSGCGGDSPAAPSQTPAPTPAPTPTPTPSPNRAPTISSLSPIPGFGIASVTAFNMSAAATDPDGDPLTFDWDLG